MDRRHLSLDGAWRIIYDPANAGRARDWHLPERFAEHYAGTSMSSTACWERFRQDYEGVAWYGNPIRRIRNAQRCEAATIAFLPGYGR